MVVLQVAISAGADSLQPYGGFIVGCVAGCVFIGVARSVERVRVDDAVDAVAGPMLFAHHSDSCSLKSPSVCYVSYLWLFFQFTLVVESGVLFPFHFWTQNRVYFT